jgi:hypothetical protein
MPDTLDRALRDVIDASADPVTVDEVLGLPQAVPRNRPRTPLLLAAAAVVLLAVVAGVLLSRGGDDTTDRQVTASTPTVTTPGLDVEDCARPLGERSMIDLRDTTCRVSTAEAEELLGFPIEDPIVPANLHLRYHDIRLWVGEDGTAEAPPEYNRAWFAPSPPCPLIDPRPRGCQVDYLQITVRRALPGEAETLEPLGGNGTIRRGVPYYGALSDDSAWFTWVVDGRIYRLRAVGVHPAAALEIAKSLP